MPVNLLDISGRTAIITGCNTGIGHAMAIGLAEAGANIIGVASSASIRDGETQQALEKLGRFFDPWQADLGDRTALYRYLEELKAKHSIDILVNIAGIILFKPVVEHPMNGEMACLPSIKRHRLSLPVRSGRQN